MGAQVRSPITGSYPQRPKNAFFGLLDYKSNQLTFRMKKALFSAALFAMPLVAFAAVHYFTGYISWAGDLLNRIIPVLIAAAMVVFFWGLVRYIYKRDSKEGRQTMIAGLVALFVMVSVWGIIHLAQNTFIGDNSAINGPQVPQRAAGTY